MSVPHLSVAHSSPLINPNKDRRQYKRVDLELGGCYLDEGSEDHKLVTENVSCSGAYLRASTVPVSGSQVICYFDDLGRRPNITGWVRCQFRCGPPQTRKAG